MDYKNVASILSQLLILFVLSMMVSLAIAGYEYLDYSNDESRASLMAFGGAIAVNILTIILLKWFSRGAEGRLFIREALLLVCLFWVIGGVLCSLPYYFWARLLGHESHAFSQFINCFFEGMSGLTTTGASILSDIEAIPGSLLFWRASIQWLGGLGIVVMFVAVLPWLSGGKNKIFRAEATGPTGGENVANLRSSTQNLFFIYSFFTAIVIVLLRITDTNLGWLPALTFAFSTTATAGFSMFNDSTATLSTAGQWVCIIFMFLCGVNFKLFNQAIQTRSLKPFRNTEFRWYVSFICISALFIFIDISINPYLDMSGLVVSDNLWRSLTDASFNVVAIQTTTGFSNANTDTFPAASKILLCFLMLVGGCAGSTGGGMKVARMTIAWSMIRIEIEKAFRPALVKAVKSDQRVIDHRTQKSVLIFIVAGFFIMFVGASLISLFDPHVELVTVVSASVACFNNIGPGFSLVGATQNYQFFSASTKALLSLFMILGRLEVFSVLVILSPVFWRR